MKKIFVYFQLIVVIPLLYFALVSCGSNKEEVVEENNLQRIVMTIEGDIERWNYEAYFKGFTRFENDVDHNCTITCDKMDEEFVYFSSKDVLCVGGSFTSFPVTVSLDGESKLYLTIGLLKKAGPRVPAEEKGLIIKLKGYKGNKETNSFSQTYFNKTAVNIGFHADKNDATGFGLEGDYTE